MSHFTPAGYGPVFAELISGDRCRSLGGGSPSRAKRRDLEQATLAAAFAHTKVADRDMANCCLAGVWLLHDFLDESHAISQSIDTTSGSYWHAVMHRREGDFSNAKYWFRRVGSHQVFTALGPRVVELADADECRAAANRIAPGGRFDPFAFVDACQTAVRTGGPAEVFCRRAQQAEWDLLFDCCYRQAAGA